MSKTLLLLFVGALVVMTVAPALFAEMSIAITEPVDGAVVGPCSNVVFKFDVQVTDETVRDVRLYYNGRPKTSIRREPWEYEWKQMLKGRYEVQALLRSMDGQEVWSDPVYVRVGSISNGEMLQNGGFDCGTTSGWTFNAHSGAIASLEVYDDFYFDDAHYLAIEIENGGEAEWHIQLNQTVPTDSGHVYEIYLLADAEEKKTVFWGMQENQEPWESQAWEPFEIDGADEYGPFVFNAFKTDPTNQFRINVGGNNIMTFFDNFRIIDRSISSVKEKKLDFDGSLLSEFELFQAYPNPFNMSTTIRYSLSSLSDVLLDIYNMQGQQVKTLVSDSRQPGTHSVQWDGTNEIGSIVPSGVYLYRLRATAVDGNTVDLSRKILLLK